MQIKFVEVWTCGSWDKHANEQTHMQADMADRHATLISHYIYAANWNLTLKIRINYVHNLHDSASFIARFKWKLHECHLILFYCSLHCGRRLHSRQKNKLHLTKSGRWAQKHRKPWTLKSVCGGGLKPRSLTEVYAYATTYK